MGETNIEGGELMIADELRLLFDQIREDLMLLRADITLINHDMLEIRKQLDRIEMSAFQQPQESIGIAPGTPPPDFIPPEMM
jgi:hypothetical protein